MTDEEYIGREFRANVEEDEGAFCGEVSVDGKEIPFTIGRMRKRVLVYDQGLKPGNYKIRISGVEETGILVARVVQRPLQEISQDIDGILQRAIWFGSLEELDFQAELLEEELRMYCPKKTNHLRVIERKQRKLAANLGVARLKREADVETKERHESYERDLIVVPGNQVPREEVIEMVARFHLFSVNGASYSRQAAQRVNMKRSFVGLVKDRIVAMLEYDDEETIPGFEDHTGLFNFGLNPLDSFLGKIFIERALSYLPKPKLYVHLAPKTKFYFFERMGFVKTKQTYTDSGDGRTRDLCQARPFYVFDGDSE